MCVFSVGTESSLWWYGAVEPDRWLSQEGSLWKSGPESHGRIHEEPFGKPQVLSDPQPLLPWSWTSILQKMGAFSDKFLFIIPSKVLCHCSGNTKQRLILMQGLYPCSTSSMHNIQRGYTTPPQPPPPLPPPFELHGHSGSTSGQMLRYHRCRWKITKTRKKMWQHWSFCVSSGPPSSASYGLVGTESRMTLECVLWCGKVHSQKDPKHASCWVETQKNLLKTYKNVNSTLGADVLTNRCHQWTAEVLMTATAETPPPWFTGETSICHETVEKQLVKTSPLLALWLFFNM